MMNTRNITAALLSASGAIAIAWTPQAALAAESSDQQGAAAGEQPAGTDIIVTAQRRSERLIDVPISVAALGSADLARANVTSTKDLAATVPGLTMDLYGSNLQPAIRGISAQVALPGAENNVAVFVDGVYSPAGTANNFELPNVEQIQVLKGPQGSLYGRNATGGAILVQFRKPSTTWHGDAEVTFGRFNDLTAKAYLSGPLTQALGLSLSGLYRDGDSWITDGIRGGRYRGITAKSVRGELVLRPSEAVELSLTGYINDRNDATWLQGQGWHQHSRNNTAVPLPTSPYVSSIDFVPTSTSSDRGANFHAKINLGGLSISSISSYARQVYTSVSDTDFGPGTIARNFNPGLWDENFQQSLDIASHFGGPVNFVAGANYINQDSAIDPIIIDAYGVVPSTNVMAGQKTEAIAVYGEVTVKPMARLSITGGLRFTHELKKQKAVLTSGATPAPRYSTVPFQQQKTWDNVSARASVQYALSDAANIYFTFSQGFKSGTFNPTTVLGPPVDPEKNNAYEIGAKARVAPGIVVTAAAYHYDYSGQQVTAYTGIIRVFQNAGNARVNGAELTLDARLSEELSLNAGLSVLDAKYTALPTYQALINTFGPTGVFLRNTPTPFNASGKYMTKAPKVTFNIGGNWRHDLGGGTLMLSGNANYSGKYYLTPDNQSIYQPSYLMLNANATYTFANGLRVGIWGKNLANEVIIGSSQPSTDADRVAYAPPRTYGVMVGYSF